jgi:hypothetical protein
VSPAQEALDKAFPVGSVERMIGLVRFQLATALLDENYEGV